MQCCKIATRLDRDRYSGKEEEENEQADKIQATVSHLGRRQLVVVGMGGRSAGALLAGPPAGHRRPEEPRQPLLPRAPEVLDIVVRPAGQVRRDPGPSVPELRLQLEHHALFLRGEPATPVEQTAFFIPSARCESLCNLLGSRFGIWRMHR